MVDMATATKQTRTAVRSQLWLEHMRRASELHGYWHSSARSRSELPQAETMAEDTIIKAINIMVADGDIVRLEPGCYIPTDMAKGEV